MIGIYFSGTGNTKHCVEKLVKLLDASAQSFPLEHTEMIQILTKHDIIVLGYPTQFSNAPIIVRDFIKNHSSLWNGKKVFCVNTMGLFSGDGTGCTARILRKRGATILGGLQIKQGNYPQDGLSFFSHLKGLFGQRLWFYGKTAGYTDKLKISEKCVGCGLCVSLCPTKNLSLRDGKATAEDRCTMCYRCISRCPQKAITLLGDEVIEQCRFEKYGSGE